MSIGSIRSLLLGLCVGAIFLSGTGYSSAARAEDTRTPVVLNEIEHDFVHAEMRGFLDSLRQVASGLVKDDLKAVADGAKLSGKAAANKAPSTLGKKFSPGFAALGSETHQLWDMLAVEAEDMGNKNEIQTQLGLLLNNCVACHSQYKLARAAP